MSENSQTNPPPKKKRMKRSVVEEFVRLFVPDEKIKLYSKRDWLTSTATVRKMLEKCEDMSFWRSVELGFPLNHVFFFTSPRGLDILRREWKKYKYTPLPREPGVKIEKEKQGDDDITIPSKPKTLKEFLNS